MSGLRRSVPLLALLLALAALGCTSRRGGGPFPDTGITVDGATDSSTMTDSTTPFDSGTTPDTSTPMDSGAPDTRPFDTGAADTGTADTGTADTGLPIGDSGLPLGDGGICIPGMIDCPVGQMCCEVLPGTGFGTCMPTCP